MNNESEKSLNEAVVSWVFPMVRYSVILPKVSVVEVTPWVQPIITAKNLTWFLGAFPWRNLSVPLISFDVMNGSNHSGVRTNSQVAIIKTIGVGNSEINRKFPYMAWIVQGKPKSVKITPESFANRSDVELGDFESCSVTFDQSVAVIPELKLVEEAIFKILNLSSIHV